MSDEKFKLIRRAYKYKLRPSASQVETFEQWFKAVRFTYNWFLKQRIDWYEAGATETPKEERDRLVNPNRKYDQSLQLKYLKKFYPFLAEPPSLIIQEAVFNVDAAFQNFFRRKTGYPRFKSFRDNIAFKFSGPKRFKFDNEGGYLHLSKCENIKVILSRECKGVIKNCTVSKDATGYYASIGVEEMIEIKKAPEQSVAIDFDVDQFIVLSDGNIMPKCKHKRPQALFRAQQKLSRKVFGSNNYLKNKKRVGKRHKNIDFKRHDFLHKHSHDLCKRYNSIIVPKIEISKFTKNVKRLGKKKKVKRSLAKADFNHKVLSQGYHEFVRQLEYKACWRNSKLLKLDIEEPFKSLKKSDRNKMSVGVKKPTINLLKGTPESATYLLAAGQSLLHVEGKGVDSL